MARIYICVVISFLLFSNNFIPSEGATTSKDRKTPPSSRSGKQDERVIVREPVSPQKPAASSKKPVPESQKPETSSVKPAPTGENKAVTPQAAQPSSGVVEKIWAGDYGGALNDAKVNIVDTALAATEVTLKFTANKLNSFSDATKQAKESYRQSTCELCKAGKPHSHTIDVVDGKVTNDVEKPPPLDGNLRSWAGKRYDNRDPR